MLLTPRMSQRDYIIQTTLESDETNVGCRHSLAHTHLCHEVGMHQNLAAYPGASALLRFVLERNLSLLFQNQRAHEAVRLAGSGHVYLNR